MLVIQRQQGFPVWAEGQFLEEEIAGQGRADLLARGQTPEYEHRTVAGGQQFAAGAQHQTPDFSARRCAAFSGWRTSSR